MMVCEQQAIITVVFHGVLTSEPTDIQKVRSGKRVPRLAGFGCRNSKLAEIC